MSIVGFQCNLQDVKLSAWGPWPFCLSHHGFHRTPWRWLVAINFVHLGLEVLSFSHQTTNLKLEIHGGWEGGSFKCANRIYCHLPRYSCFFCFFIWICGCNDTVLWPKVILLGNSSGAPKDVGTPLPCPLPIPFTVAGGPTCFFGSLQNFPWGSLPEFESLEMEVFKRQVSSVKPSIWVIELAYIG